ncbi:MAG TPA: RidA family protein, partial [Acidimicrobiales bacterium]|nr:RidA family protein [Acidimicrobiales bacterium]
MPGRVSQRLAELGLTLYGPHPPHDPLDAVVVHGDVARTSGQLPRIAGELTCVGTLGRDVTVEEGARAAEVCALNALAVLEHALGSLDRVARVLTVTG